MANELARALLGDAGYLDVDYIERQAESLNLDYSDIMERVREIFVDIKDLNANALIGVMQDLLIDKARYIIEESETNDGEPYPDLDDGEHYTTFINCIDSHIWADEDAIFRDYGQELGQDIINILSAW